jgi:hypothetical protein
MSLECTAGWCFERLEATMTDSAADARPRPTRASHVLDVPLI